MYVINICKYFEEELDFPMDIVNKNCVKLSWKLNDLHKPLHANFMFEILIYSSILKRFHNQLRPVKRLRVRRNQNYDHNEYNLWIDIRNKIIVDRDMWAVISNGWIICLLIITHQWVDF